MNEPRPGTETTEYERTRAAGRWGVVGLLLGAAIAVGPGVVERIWGADQTSTAYIVAGAALSVASVLYKTLVDLGYVKSRTDVKVVTAQIVGQASNER